MVETNKAVLVVGGGPAGMQASLLLAATGVQVYLVDRAPAIGGHQPLLDKTFPTNSCGLCFMSPKPAAYCPFVECERSDRISILTMAEVTGLSGGPGDFVVELRVAPRKVDPSRCTGCGSCGEACPVEVPAELGGGLERRKAIYRPCPQAVPDGYLVDAANCSRCGECLKVCPGGAIDLDQGTEHRTLRVGAVIVTPGLKAVDGAERTEYGYGVYPNVISGIQMERMLSSSGPTGGAIRRPSDGVTAQRIAFIQCVGSRDPSRDRAYCSSVCCMYAAKQVALLKDRSPNASVTVFQRDLRAMGKGYEEYMERVQGLEGVEYRRSAVGRVRQLPGSRELLVSFVDTEGAQREETFDLAVLSVGLEPSQGVRQLAGTMGLPLNVFGFLESDPLIHEESPLPGIFVAGGGREPMDLADSVAEGAAAAMRAASLLRVGLVGFGGWGTEGREEQDGQDRQDGLGGREDVGSPLPLGEGQGEGDSLKDPFNHPDPPFGRPLPEVEANGSPAGTGSYGMGAPGAGGAPTEAPRVGVLLCRCGGEIGGKLDLPTLATRLRTRSEIASVEVVDRLCEGDGAALLRRSLQQGVNRLVVAACARRKIEDLMRVDAAEAGVDPSLVELVSLREQCVWVHGSDAPGMFDKAEGLVAMGVAKAARAEPSAVGQTVVTPTALVVGGGAAGLTATAFLAEQGVEVWLAEKEPRLGGDLRRSSGRDSRQAEGELLDTLLAGVEGTERVHLLTAARVEQIEGHLGTFESRIVVDGREERVAHSAVVLATGGEERLPEGYLLGEHPAVMTQGQLERALAEDGWVDRHPVVAMLLCAGSMETEIGGYCSRSCCAEAVANARRVKKLNPSAQVYVLYREMRSYGFFELEYEAARREGVIFLRFDPQERPELVPDGDAIRISVREPSLGRTVVIEADALVLAVGVRPTPDRLVATHLGVEVDRHGFYREANVKTRGTEAVVPGVFLCGAGQSPRSLPDTIVHAKAAAMRALALLSPGSVVSPATAVAVNERICSGCGLCVEACSFGARVLDLDKNVSTVVDTLCQGCGACAAVCPNGATQQRGFTGSQMIAVLDAALD